MSHDANPVERFLDRTARKLTGSRLHPLEILQDVRSSFESRARDGVAPNGIVIHLSSGDYENYEPQLDTLKDSIVEVALDSCRRLGLRPYGDWYIDVVPRPTMTAGEARVRAFFAATNGQERDLLHETNATRRLFRLQGVALLLSDGRRVPVTHAPFSIGRGPGNDLVIASLAVSREHAELRQTPEGLVLADLGSRNGILVDGQSYREVELEPGMVVTLGDVDLRMEIRQ
jgi:hypothetical protein